MTRETVIQIRCSTTEKDEWKARASSKGLKLSEFIREALREAATEAKPAKVSKPVVKTEPAAEAASDLKSMLSRHFDQ